MSAAPPRGPAAGRPLAGSRCPARGGPGRPRRRPCGTWWRRRSGASPRRRAIRSRHSDATPRRRRRASRPRGRAWPARARTRRTGSGPTGLGPGRRPGGRPRAIRIGPRSRVGPFDRGRHDRVPPAPGRDLQAERGEDLRRSSRFGRSRRPRPSGDRGPHPASSSTMRSTTTGTRPPSRRVSQSPSVRPSVGVRRTRASNSPGRGILRGDRDAAPREIGGESGTRRPEPGRVRRPSGRRAVRGRRARGAGTRSTRNSGTGARSRAARARRGAASRGSRGRVPPSSRAGPGRGGRIAGRGLRRIGVARSPSIRASSRVAPSGILTSTTWSARARPASPGDAVTAPLPRRGSRGRPPGPARPTWPPGWPRSADGGRGTSGRTRRPGPDVREAGSRRTDRPQRSPARTRPKPTRDRVPGPSRPSRPVARDRSRRAKSRAKVAVGQQQEGDGAVPLPASGRPAMQDHAIPAARGSVTLHAPPVAGRPSPARAAAGIGADSTVRPGSPRTSHRTGPASSPANTSAEVGRGPVAAIHGEVVIQGEAVARDPRQGPRLGRTHLGRGRPREHAPAVGGRPSPGQHRGEGHTQQSTSYSCRGRVLRHGRRVDPHEPPGVPGRDVHARVGPDDPGFFRHAHAERHDAGQFQAAEPVLARREGRDVQRDGRVRVRRRQRVDDRSGSPRRDGSRSARRSPGGAPDLHLLDRPSGGEVGREVPAGGPGPRAG